MHFLVERQSRLMCRLPKHTKHLPNRARILFPSTGLVIVRQLLEEWGLSQNTNFCVASKEVKVIAVGVSLLCFLWMGLELTPAALSLASTSFSKLSISLSKSQLSSVISLLIINRISYGSLLTRTDASRLPYVPDDTPCDLKLLTWVSTTL